MVKPRLVERHDRPKPHRDRGKLPEIRHQIRMRIGGQPAAFGEFLAEILQMPFVETAFQKCAGIDSRRGMALKKNQVAGEILGRPAEKMIEAHFVKRRRRGISGNVTADVGGGIGLDDHGHGVPAHQTFDAALDFAVSRIGWLSVRRNGIEIRGGDRRRRARGSA